MSVRSRPAIWTSFSTRSDLAALLPKDQPKELLVFRNDEGQLLSVFERGAKILGFILSFAVKRDEPMARSSANQEDCAFAIQRTSRRGLTREHDCAGS